MASPPPPRGPGRQQVGKTIRRGFDRIKRAIQPSSSQSSPNPGSTAALSTIANLVPPAPFTILGQSTATQPAPSHGSGVAGQQLTGPSTLVAGPAIAAVTTAPAGLRPTTTNLQGGRSVLETTLRMLEQSANAFPPLKSAVANLVGCLDIVQVSANDDSSKSYN